MAARHRRTSAVAAVVAVVVLAVAGCSPATVSGNPNLPKSSAGGSGVVTSAGSSAAPSVGNAPLAARCDQLTVADVQPMMVGPVTPSPARAVGPTDHPGQECAFDSDEGGEIDVMVMPGEFGLQMYAHDIGEQGADAVPVSGVGDKASRKRGDIAVSAISGSLYCSITGVGEGMPGVGDWELSHGGTATVPDAIAEAAVNVIATLCNRIYGTGSTTPDLAALKAAVAAN